MAARVIDNFTTAWTADPSGLWTSTAVAGASRLGVDGLGMSIVASAGAAGDVAPFVRRDFSPALDLRDALELRFWLRSSRQSTGSAQHPFYLVLEAGSGTSVAWSRFIRVGQANTWELQRMLLSDMPDEVRRAVGFLRLRATTTPAVPFDAALDDMWAGTPHAIQDVEATLLSRLDRRFDVIVGGTKTAVPAVMHVPENSGSPALPSIRISPWAVLPLTENQGAEEIDNETATGAFARPRPQRIRLDYRVDVFAAERAQKAYLVEAIVTDLARDPRLVVFDEPLTVAPFQPDPLETGPYEPGRTPLYYRVTAWSEMGPRVFRPRAVPFLATGQRGSTARPEYTAI